MCVCGLLSLWSEKQFEAFMDTLKALHDKSKQASEAKSSFVATMRCVCVRVCLCVCVCGVCMCMWVRARASARVVCVLMCLRDCKARDPSLAAF